jgi:RNA polymerase sigma factor (sigma-70 family)
VTAQPGRSDEPAADARALRMFLAAGRAGDDAAARRHWVELLELNFDRVLGLVRLEAAGRLSDDEIEDACAAALERIATRLMVTFRGSSMGEWVGAVKQLVHYSCIDTQRRAARRPAERPLEHDDGRTDAAALAAIERERRELEAAADDDELRDEWLARGRDFLAWALPQLPPRLRETFELLLEGLGTEAICARLGVSADVVYQSRRRALQTLTRLGLEWDG